MKHVFVVHSHTVFLTALGTINLLNISSDNIIFIYARNYKNSVVDIPYRIVNMTNENRKGAYMSVLHIFSYKKLINEVDQKIRRLINDEYVLYAPHAGSHFFQILLTNPMCVQFNFIQEGALAFDELLSNKISVKSVGYAILNSVLYLFYKNRVWANFRWILKESILKKYASQSFAISPDIFEILPYTKKNVKWPSIQPPMDINPNYPCFVFEASVEMNVIERSVYFDCIKELLEIMSEAHNYAKFHPGQSVENKNAIKKLFINAGKSIEILPDDIPFELYLSSYSHLKVYGFYSSLLIYAKQLGHTTFSLENRLKQKSSRYVAWRKHMSEIGK